MSVSKIKTNQYEHTRSFEGLHFSLFYCPSGLSTFQLSLLVRACHLLSSLMTSFSNLRRQKLRTHSIDFDDNSIAPDL